MKARSRLETLRRLVTMYAVVEEMHSAELRRMTAAVRATEEAIGVEEKVACAAHVDGRRALTVADSVGWMMAETQQETAAWRRGRLEQIRREREKLNETAREQYVASRLKREQMNRLLEDLALSREIEEVRRMQAISDDRFLARRRWRDAQKLRQEVQLIKSS
jgi:hypothetical protein